jgi:starch phosphorylase
MYDKLENVILPMYYERPQAYAEVMRSAIAINGSFFNTHRMLSQYLANAYMLEEHIDQEACSSKSHAAAGAECAST